MTDVALEPWFDAHYKRQKIVTDEEWPLLMEAFKRPLPITFRLLNGTVHTSWVRQLIHETMAKSPNLKSVEWYKGYGEAFQITVTRAELRADPVLKDFSSFLVKQSEAGLIVRQELVSMIPAMFLIDEMKTDDCTILDLCSAPGSKTSQLLDALEKAKPAERKSMPPRGAVIANDIKSARTHMLIHHLKFHNAPTLFVTVHDAERFPEVWVEGEQLRYDGVLCDVPCSGDGTLRKAKDAYAKWRPQNGISLHKVQRGILKRGISLCKPGGRIVYSTCSLSPIENEAVVASVLGESEGCIEIEKVEIPVGLISRPGLQVWEVEKERSNWRSTPSADGQPAGKVRKVDSESLYPPTSSEIIEELKKCNRFYPHDNDTGGFFVTVFRKVAPSPWEKKPLRKIEQSPSPTPVSEVTTPSDLPSGRVPRGQQDDMKCLAVHEKGEHFAGECLSRYGFPEGEARDLLMKYLWCSNEEKIPKVWFVSERCQSILNGLTMRSPMKVVGAGTVFASNRTSETPRISVGGYKLAHTLLQGHGYSINTNCDSTKEVTLECLAKLMEARAFNFGVLPLDDPDRIFYKETVGPSQENYMFVAELDGEKVMFVAFIHFKKIGMSGRAFEGTIPNLEIGVKIGGSFEKDTSFIKYRHELFDELNAVFREAPTKQIKVTFTDGREYTGDACTPADLAKQFWPNINDFALARALVKESLICDCMIDIDDQAPENELVEEFSLDHLNGLLCPIKQEDSENAIPRGMTKKLLDMTERIEFEECILTLVRMDDFEKDKDLQGVFWHSSAHLLGLACEQHFGAKVTIGPALKNGFYYDFYIGDHSVVDEDHEKLMKAAKDAVNQNYKFEKLICTKDQALHLFKHNPFKLALINAKVHGNTSVYRCGPFIDLCMGPHLPSLKYVKAFRVERHSSAYWLGSSEADSLQRVYGVAFPDNKIMNNYLEQVKEAKKRDHRVLGEQLDLFFFEPMFSPGSAFWLPAGAKIYNKLQDLVRTEYLHRGFTEVGSPNLFSCDIFKVSGHYQNYQDSMFLLDVEGKEWGLKPMNCPGHCCMFKKLNPSYKNLPLRLADFGVLHRNEFSGSLSGLTRVRRFQQDDAHIFCTLEQLTSETLSALDFLFFIYGLFGFQFKLYLSTRPKKALGDVALWNKAEQHLAKALNSTGAPWTINKGDGAFYGPKIDIELYDALGRGHQCGTIQCDFQLPLRFDLKYKTAEDIPTADDAQPNQADVQETQPKEADVPQTQNEAETKPEDERTEVETEKTSSKKKHFVGSLETELKPGYGRPVMIHRAILGSIERITAVILEHTAGRLPFWLSPRQAIVLPISPKYNHYGDYVRHVIHNQGYDVEMDGSSKTISRKVRDAQIQQWNFMVIVGHTEEEAGNVVVRVREDPKGQETMTLAELLSKFADLKDIARRRPDSEIPQYVPCSEASS